MDELMRSGITEVAAGGIFVILAIRGLVELVRAINQRVNHQSKDACNVVSKVLLQQIREHQETRCEEIRDCVSRTEGAVGRLEAAINRLNDNLAAQNRALERIADKLSRREE